MERVTGVNLIFAHDTEVALAAAAALVNTDDGDDEHLPDIAALDEFVRAWGWTGDRQRDEAELRAVRELRPRLRRLWEVDEPAVVNSSGTTNGTTTCTRRRPTPHLPLGWQSRPPWRSWISCVARS